jgi:predicted RNA methylase
MDHDMQAVDAQDGGRAMKALYFASFVPGFGGLVRRLIERDAPGSRILSLEDNALRFEYDSEPTALFAYCRSLFRLLGEYKPDAVRGSSVQLPSRLAGAAQAFARDRRLLSKIGRARSARNKTFVLRVFGPDDPESLLDSPRALLEDAIARAVGGRADPRGGPGAREFRLQARADGSALFLERLFPPGRRGREPDLRRGELPRTTCRLLVELTEPRPEDVFLDPFCGYGGIALERALAAPYRFVFAQDRDPAKIAAVKECLRDRAFEKRRKTFFPKVRDALDLEAFSEGFIDAIATDPPWGEYEAGPESAEAEALLRSFIQRASILLGVGGRLVLLVARSLCPKIEAAAGGAFVLREEFPVLISGKKASVLRFDRLD